MLTAPRGSPINMPIPSSAIVVHWIGLLGLCLVLGTDRSYGATQASSQAPDASQTNLTSIDLQTTPFDRILLRDGTVYECEPLQPRPLSRMEPLSFFEIQPQSTPGESVKVIWQDVKSITYFEDILLSKADLLREAGQFGNAFDYLQAVRERDNRWPGLSERFDRLLMDEAKDDLEQGRPLRTVSLLGQLLQRNPQYPDLSVVYDKAAGQLLDRAGRGENYRYLRWLLRRCDDQFPGRPIVGQWREKIAERARSRVAEAVKHENEGDLAEAARAIHHAGRIWPDLPGLQEILARIQGKYSFVTVAVEQLPHRFGLPEITRAQRRAHRLVYQSLIAPPVNPEPDTYALQLAADYETADLGRRIAITLRPQIRWSDGLPLTAMDIAYVLSSQMDRGHRDYRPVWAALAPAIHVESPQRLTVQFTEPPLRPEALVQFPVVRSQDQHGNVRPLRQAPQRQSVLRPAVGTGPFVPSTTTDSQVNYLRNRYAQQATGVALHEVIETRVEDTGDALRALVQGQVTLVAHVAPFQLKKLRGTDPQVAIAAYAGAPLHFIGFDFQNPILRNRTLRRAMVYAIDRQTILNVHLLAGQPTERDHVISGPFHHSSAYASSSLQPRPYHPILAAGLALKAKEELGGTIATLKLHHPPDDVAREACRHIDSYLRAAGIDVELVERDDYDLYQDRINGKSLDMVYRIVTIREPTVDTPELLAFATGNADPSFHVAGPWLRQLLVQLRQAPNMTTAHSVLQEIHQVVYDGVTILPLWQVSDYFAYDKRLRGLDSNPLELYQNIDQWRLDAAPVFDAFALEP